MTDLTHPPRFPGSPYEVFRIFLRLGLTSFGGPMAHIGFFRAEFVDRQRWLNDEQFGQLLAICQFLPGPASSQLGFSIGLLRAGWSGAISAFVGFTLPSVLLLFIFASMLPVLSGPVAAAGIHGLKLVACAVVADAVLGMANKLCPDTTRKSIAILATATLLLTTLPFIQLAVVIGAGVCGCYFLRHTVHSNVQAVISVPYSKKRAGAFLLGFVALLFILPIAASNHTGLVYLSSAFYQAGALVFGGGHVVLPLLEASVVTNGLVSSEQFLAGYGASQAIPGPMFAFSAYLGALISPQNNAVTGASLALLFMFLPGFLLVTAALPFWQSIGQSPLARNALSGVNAGVVGLLAATLYDPIFTSGVTSAPDLAIVTLAFGMLTVWRVSPLYVVIWCVGASMCLTVF